MTAVTKTVNNLVEESLKISEDAPQVAWGYTGSYYSRVSTGADRSAGSYPPKIRSPIYYITKPRYSKGKKISDGLTKTRYKWVYQRPSRPSFEEEHAYTARHTNINNSKGVAVKRLGVWYWLGTPWNWDFAQVVDPWTSSDDLHLLGKLREAIAGSSFNAGVALAEAPKSLKMITESATQIYMALKAVKKGKPQKAVQILTGRTKPNSRDKKLVPTKEAASSNWLALQYGWKPLLSDIYEGSIYLDHLMNRPAVTRVAVTRYAGGKKDHYMTFNLPSTYATIPITVKSSTRLIAKLTAVNQARLSGLLDPASVAWEILPFSFVADWFIPIGNWLEAQNLSRSITGSFVTTHRWSWKKFFGVQAKTSWQLSTLNDGARILMSRHFITRTVSTTLTIPTPEVKPLSKVASWTRATSAVALLVGIFKG